MIKVHPLSILTHPNCMGSFDGQGLEVQISPIRMICIHYFIKGASPWEIDKFVTLNPRATWNIPPLNCYGQLRDY